MIDYSFSLLYKLDSKGKVRVWYMEIEDDKYHTISGLEDGKKVISTWTVAVANTLRTAEEQANFEVEAAYKFQQKGDYFEDRSKIGKSRVFEPMLANKYEGLEKLALPVYAQPKLDGIRAIVSKDGVKSRTGESINAVPHILEALESFFEKNPDAVLDGELYNHDLKEDFNKISSLVRKKTPTAEELKESAEIVQYHIYDYPSEGYRTFSERYELLPFFSNYSIVVLPTEKVGTQERLDFLMELWLEKGYEGQIIRLDKPYENKRSKFLLKRKEFQDAEYEVVRIEEGLGNWSGMAKKVICRLPDGREFGAGIIGNQTRAKELLQETHKVVTVKFFRLTPDGIPRFGVVTKFHGEERTL